MAMIMNDGIVDVEVDVDEAGGTREMNAEAPSLLLVTMPPSCKLALSSVGWQQCIVVTCAAVGLLVL
jgi:hypothetical protein